MSFSRKPRLVYFQYKYDRRLPRFLLLHKEEHVKCLASHFSVILIAQDCDYQQVCDRYEPDLALFESGVPHPSCQRLAISNTRACAHIPKLGLLHADAFCQGREGFLSDMDEWGIDTFFAIATRAGEHMPDIRDNLFIWPNFVDVDVYRDYGERKTIPVLFTGNAHALYPWRRKIVRIVQDVYPSLICPHPGYAASGSAGSFVVGEEYARLLNASWFVPACGSVAQEIVRKHFEIPACRSCLVTERSPALEEAGFIDMRNCVFADASDVLDKLGYLFHHRERLESIITAGHQLVRTQHSMSSRDQILQWYVLSKCLKPGQRIVQPNLFAPMIAADPNAETQNWHASSKGAHLTLLEEGDHHLWADRIQEARRCYLRCLEYITYMPEPKVRLALCDLRSGRARDALSWILQPIEFTLGAYKAREPDPAEWAYLVVTLLCLGRLSEARVRANQFPWLVHPELTCARWAVDALLSGSPPRAPAVDGGGNGRFSVHQFPKRNFVEWIDVLCILLTVNGHASMAKRLRSCASVSAAAASVPPVGITDFVGPGPTENNRAAPELDTRKARHVHVYFRRRLLVRSLKSRSRRFIRDVLHGLETQYGYFLAYHLSTVRNEPFVAAVRQTAENPDLRRALVITTDWRKAYIRAQLAGADANPANPSVFCVQYSTGPFAPVPTFHEQRGTRHWFSVRAGDPSCLLGLIDGAIAQILQHHGAAPFDAVLIDGDSLDQWPAADSRIIEAASGARFVFIAGRPSYLAYKVHCSLLRDRNFELRDGSADAGHEYSIFRRSASARQIVGTSSDVLDHAVATDLMQ